MWDSLESLTHIDFQKAVILLWKRTIWIYIEIYFHYQDYVHFANVHFDGDILFVEVKKKESREAQIDV